MDIGRVCVVGAGVMGRGIAEVLLRAGIAVKLVDVKEEALAGARRELEASFSAKPGGISPEELDGALSASTALEPAACDFAIEAVYEDEAVKREVFSRLGKALKPEGILATNTSALSVSLLAEASGRPERFCGMHFMNPAPRMKLVEVVRGEHTSDETVSLATALAKRLGKRAVVVKDSPGFVVNRLLIPMINGAAELLRRGVAPKEAIDAAMRLGANHPLGPLALGDLIGLDVVKSIMETLSASCPRKYELSPLIDEMVGKGLLGKKSGEGFFRYPGRKKR